MTTEPTGSAPRLHLPRGSAEADGDPLVITPESAGWRYTGLRIVELGPGEARDLATARDEVLVLPLRGGCFIEVDGERFALAGRESPFECVSDFAYVPVGAHATVSSGAGATLALPSARAERRYPPAYGAAEAVAVEVRGAGPATRQINNLFAPGVLEAQRLVVVEVLTPAGNTSSHPPHKHDRSADGEAELEEIYYFRFDRPGAFGFHRTYAADGTFDVTATVEDGDAFLVPNGYHGPCAAPPGYPMYYLNVLAGPGDERSLAFRDDPEHAWIRASWDGEPRDPRVPMTSARGRR
jgi:5-deoxy-glucuronate isomerase